MFLASIRILSVPLRWQRKKLDEHKGKYERHQGQEELQKLYRRSLFIAELPVNDLQPYYSAAANTTRERIYMLWPGLGSICDNKIATLALVLHVIPIILY